MKTIALALLLLVTTTSAFAAGPLWTLDKAHKAIDAQCPSMRWFANPAVTVDISKDKASGDYLYRYTIQSRPGDAQIFEIRLLDLPRSPDPSDPKVVSSIHGWPFGCYFGICTNTTSARTDGIALEGLVLRSKYGPGVIRYDIASSDSRPNVFDPEEMAAITRAARQAAGPAGGAHMEDAVSEAMQESAADDCPGLSVPSDVLHDISGVTLGPSEVRTAQAELGGQETAPTIRFLDSDGVRAADIDPRSLQVTDTRGHAIALKSGTLDSFVSAGYGVALGVPVSAMACNAKGLIVTGKSLDGRPFRTGVAVGTAPCMDTHDRFSFSLPDGTESGGTD